jgi:predicted unusual protein kinase regulating ubiquinone biosynthesis (AarF/ABC1/UbiB family)
LRDLLVAVGTRDAARAVKAYQAMGVLLPEADLGRLEQAGALMFERFWGKDMTELTSMPIEEMRQFADEFRDPAV